jgi:hypothetical protein
MKQILKKDLLNLITESHAEMGEMAYKPKGTQDSGGRIRKFKPIYKDGSNGGTDQDPDGWILNPNQIEGEDKAYFFLAGQDLESFIEENREFLDSIANKIGQDRVCIQDGNRTKCQPRSLKAGTQYVPSGNKMSAETKIKRSLNSLVEQYMASPEISEKLSRLSIPEVRARDRKHLDRYSKISNSRIEYATHTFNSYESAQQFLKFVTSRITGKETPEEYKSYHLARQFNRNYQRWEETRKNTKQYYGKTPSYMLDQYGFDEDNLDVTVRMDFKISGVLTNEEYVWTVKFMTKFGRKLKEDRYLNGGLDLDKEITISKRIPLEGGEDFNEERTVMDSLPIKSGLIEALDELKDRIMAMKPIETLKLANVQKFDVTKKIGSDL